VEHFFSEFSGLLEELHFRYTEQLLLALLPIAITVLIHARGMSLVSRCFKRFVPHSSPGARNRPHILLVIVVVSIILSTHFLEIVAWAIFYDLMNLLPDSERAMYFSMNIYSTMGASNIMLPERWRGIEGFEAITSMLMFGWSTAVLATVVQRLHPVDE
jgi:hypothetical protein